MVLFTEGYLQIAAQLFLQATIIVLDYLLVYTYQVARYVGTFYIHHVYEISSIYIHGYHYC